MERNYKESVEFLNKVYPDRHITAEELEDICDMIEELGESMNGKPAKDLLPADIAIIASLSISSLPEFLKSTIQSNVTLAVAATMKYLQGHKAPEMPKTKGICHGCKRSETCSFLDATKWSENPENEQEQRNFVEKAAPEVDRLAESFASPGLNIKSIEDIKQEIGGAMLQGYAYARAYKPLPECLEK